MYHLPYFKEDDPQVVKEFMRSHPFVFLTGVDAELKPVVTQVPVFIDETDGQLLLTGHMMRNTDHHKAFMQNPEALAVFSGPHSFVSASWYSDKKQGGTWNYMSVHARGRIRFLNEEALRKVLQRTTDHFEENPESGANYKDLSEEYIARHIKAIAAFEINVSSIENVFKLSQNRDAESYKNIIHQLDHQGGDAAKIAEEMNRRGLPS
ncbi:MAG: FMN-binding negative transcriptional regulator [Chitinophagaceae bacterium]|nr:FMN-binding negative transcriptional regulator [Chitinophagaceae bacterium]